MSRPLITVLMALYNGGSYLKQSVQSVLDQTYDNFEFLIINDCSTDDSLKVIESFQDKRIKVYTNEKNLGQTPSLNIGVKLARGDYFARMDGDDVALPRWLQAQVEAIEKYPDFSVISSYALAIDENNKIKKVYKPPLERKDIIVRSLITPPIHHVGSILKKKDILKVGGYEDRFIYAADYDLWERLIKNDFKITTTPEVLVAIREHSRSVSRSEHGRRDIEEIKEIAARNITRFVKLKLSDDEVSLFCRANYDEGSLTAAEFSKAVALTKSVYTNLVPSLGIEAQEMSQWMRRRCTTIYLKRIFDAIGRKDYDSVKELSFKAMKEFGPLSKFTVLWGISFLGGIALDFIPFIYHKMLKTKAHLGPGLQSSTKT